ncbi:hypothetical protein JCM16303_007394 [Sporobolomyces ruberrimus]
MSSHTAIFRMTPDLIAEACKETTLRLSEYEAGAHLAPDSLAIVFSGCAGAFLWAYALKRGRADSHLIEFVNQHVGFINSASRSLAPVPIHAVIHGAKHDQRIPILHRLFHTFKGYDEPFETTMNPQEPLDIWVNYGSQGHHGNSVAVPCSVSFYDSSRPIPAATRVRVLHGGTLMGVATANPAQLLFEAFKDIKAYHPEDYNFAHDKPLAHPSFETVTLLHSVIEAALEHAQGSPSIRIGFPFSRNPPDVVVDNLERIVENNAEYNDVEKWLLNVDTALTRELEHSHVQGQVLHRQRAFHYLKKFFDRFYDFQPKLVDLTQAEDTFHFPSWPSSPHAASSR